jgi:hypothetical protein
MADVTTKVDDTFFQLTGNQISNTSYMRLYNILLDTDRETNFMNIFKSVTINEEAQTDILAYDTYEVAEGEFWDNISYQVYGTPFLWWVVALMNNVSNPFEELEAGTNIKILKTQNLPILFSDMDRISEL